MALSTTSHTSSSTIADLDICNLGFDEEFIALSASPTPSEFSAVEGDETITQIHSDTPRPNLRTKLNPHPKYFFEDGNLLVRVEGVDFKVHRYFFMRDSAPFREFSKNGLIGRIADNGSDNSDAAEHTTPLVFKHLTRLDFERFLSVLYPTRFGEDEDRSTAHWTSVLCVSSYLSFQSVRSLSISTLSIVATPIDKIILGRRYGITHWLDDAYCALCTRRTPLTREEGRRLGLDDVVSIMEARQILLWERPTLRIEEQREVVNKIIGLGSKPALTTPPRTPSVSTDRDSIESRSQSPPQRQSTPPVQQQQPKQQQQQQQAKPKAPKRMSSITSLIRHFPQPPEIPQRQSSDEAQLARLASLMREDVPTAPLRPSIYWSGRKRLPKKGAKYRPGTPDSSDDESADIIGGYQDSSDEEDYNADGFILR
ncbi:hypothetical protein AX16_008941 [Volvariella volvacea WC 439]|nr:hypothetical protein AX16_008941 [Volvariella volvacea WC 439]